MSPAPSRFAVFQALAAGQDVAQVRQQFGLSVEELQEIFQEAAKNYRQLEQGSWTLYSDGASRGNPGQAGAGIVLLDPAGEIRLQYGDYLGHATNNEAEYRALLLGLAKARELGLGRLEVKCDSELLVRQLNGIYRVKQPHLLKLWQEAQAALQRFSSWNIRHVPREMNSLADKMANRAIDRKGPVEVK
jgi:ribonuclease HI